MVTVLAPVSLPSIRSAGRLAIVAVAFVVLLAGFWRHERALERHLGEDIALVPPAIFRRRSVAVGLFILGVYFVGTAGFNVVLVYYLQQGDGLSQTVTGLLSSTLGAGFALGSAMAHRVTARLGLAAIVLGCVLMVATRLLLIAGQSLHHATGLAVMAVLIAVTGAAQGIVVPPLMNVVLGSVTTRLSGVASGVLLTICNCAIALGQAVFLALYSAVRFPADASAQFVTTLWVMTALAAVAAVVSASALRMFRRDQGVVHEDSIPQ
jgi:Na+/melibiose symporter-like transporter